MKRCWFPCTTTGPESLPTISLACSTRTGRVRAGKRAPGWDSSSAAESSTLTADACGSRANRREERPSSSRSRVRASESVAWGASPMARARIGHHHHRMSGGVLIVDDEPDLREAFRDVLIASGFEAHTAEDGAAALELVRDGVVPDVILLDLMMPRMNGWRFIEELRRLPGFAETPVVLLSAHPR